MSFDILKDFLVSNIYIGNPKDDYNITAAVDDPSELGELRSDLEIMQSFQYYTSRLLVKGYQYDMYKYWFSTHPKLQFLLPTFSESKLLLIDRYISIYVNPQFEHFLKFLRDVACTEQQINESESWFWRIICVRLPPGEESNSVKTLRVVKKEVKNESFLSKYFQDFARAFITK